MWRINYTMAVAASLLLHAPSSFAVEGNHRAISVSNAESIDPYTKGDIRQVAASTLQGSDQRARSDAAAQQQLVQSKPASAAVTIEYPALALLAMAIISMAALSRRDSFRIDR